MDLLRYGIINAGVIDKDIDLFEGQYETNGIRYNSYVISGKKTAVIDAVDGRFSEEWLKNLKFALGDKTPDYLIVQHVEPDHSGSISAFMKTYPETTVVSSVKGFFMMKNFYGEGYENNRIEIKDGDELDLIGLKLKFITAPMVHWPEVFLTYDETNKVLFSADAFGRFGVKDGEADEIAEARRYYFGIVGKYGAQVQNLLKKAAGLEISVICSLHGFPLADKIPLYVKLYDVWSSYAAEDKGVTIVYSSIYKNTEKAAYSLKKKLEADGAANVEIFDLLRSDIHKAVASAFRYGSLVIASVTYNGDLFPKTREFINALIERNYQNRTIGYIENGSWSPQAGKHIKAAFENSKNVAFAENNVTIVSAADEETEEKINALSKELVSAVSPAAKDGKFFRKIGYGLYVLTTNDGKKDNAMIANNVVQLSGNPERVAVTVNKSNYSCEVIKTTGKMNVNVLTESAPFSVFEKFGFKSGRDTDKTAGVNFSRSDNGLMVITDNVNAFASLETESVIDAVSHEIFICRVTESKAFSDETSMTYDYYHKNVKPADNRKKGYVCSICGYVYEGEELPSDFICPICKHGAGDFEKIK